MPLEIPALPTASQFVYWRLQNTIGLLYSVEIQLGVPTTDVVGTGGVVVSVIPGETSQAKSQFHSTLNEKVVVNIYVDSERDESGNVVTHNAEGRARALFFQFDPLLDYSSGTYRYREFNSAQALAAVPIRHVVSCQRFDEPTLFHVDDDEHAVMYHCEYELQTLPPAPEGVEQ